MLTPNNKYVYELENKPKNKYQNIYLNFEHKLKECVYFKNGKMNFFTIKNNTIVIKQNIYEPNWNIFNDV